MPRSVVDLMALLCIDPNQYVYFRVVVKQSFILQIDKQYRRNVPFIEEDSLRINWKEQNVRLEDCLIYDRT